MSKKLEEILFEELSKEIKTPTCLNLVKDFNLSKEDWENYKQKLLKEFEEVDKYFEEKEKNEKKPILTEEERDYLTVVIKPFRNKIRYIKKTGYGEEYIEIKLDGDYALLPSYEEGRTYEGMEKEKSYTLEELGL